MKLRAIASQLGISLNSAHRWTKDIQLSPNQIEANRAGPFGSGWHTRPEVVARRAEAWSELNRERRRSYQREGRTRAREREPMHIAGCMLYWAEGTKGRNLVRIANSDAQVLVFFARFLRECLEVDDDRFALTLNVYTGNGLSIEEIEKHWMELLGLERSSLRKHQLNHYPSSSSRRKRNRHPYGLCEVMVTRSTRELQHIYGAIQEYGGFEEPRWLDGPPSRRREKVA